MRKPPLRQGVGGKALVKNHHRRLQPRIVQVGIELRQKLRHHHALVDDGAGGQRRHIEDRVLGLEFFFAAAARQEQFAIEGGRIDVGRCVHENLLDEGQAFERLGTACRRIGGQGAKPRDAEALEPQLFTQRLARRGGLGGIATQEHQAGREQRRQIEARLGRDGA